MRLRLAALLALAAASAVVAVSEYNSDDLHLTVPTMPAIPEVSLNKLKKAGLVQTQRYDEEDVAHYEFRSPSFLATKAKTKAQVEAEQAESEEEEETEEEQAEDQSEEEGEEAQEEEGEEEEGEEQAEEGEEQQASLLEQQTEQEAEAEAEAEEERLAQEEEEREREREEEEQFLEERFGRDGVIPARFSQQEVEDRDAVMERHRQRVDSWRAKLEAREDMGQTVSLEDAKRMGAQQGFTMKDIDNLDLSKVDLTSLGFSNSKDLLGGYDSNALPPNANIPSLNAAPFPGPLNTAADPRFAPYPSMQFSQQPAKNDPTLLSNPMGYVWANSPRTPPRPMPVNYAPFSSSIGALPLQQARAPWPQHVSPPAEMYLPPSMALP